MWRTAARFIFHKPYQDVSTVLKMHDCEISIRKVIPDALDSLPEDVVHALQLNPDWMRAKFPSHVTFVDVSSL